MSSPEVPVVQVFAEPSWPSLLEVTFFMGGQTDRGHDADDTPTCPAEGPSDIVSSRGHHAICVTKAVPCLSPLPSKSKISLVSRS